MSRNAVLDRTREHDARDVARLGAAGWCSSRETQALLRCSRKTLWRLRGRGELIAARIGQRKLLYSIASINALLARGLSNTNA